MTNEQIYRNALEYIATTAGLQEQPSHMSDAEWLLRMRDTMRSRARVALSLGRENGGS